jgi:hypothetical protein
MNKTYSYLTAIAQFVIICFVIQLTWNNVFKYVHWIQADLLQVMSACILLLVMIVFISLGIKSIFSKSDK